MTVAVNTLNNIVHLMAMAWVDKSGAVPQGKIAVRFSLGWRRLWSRKIDAISVHEPSQRRRRWNNRPASGVSLGRRAAGF